jgi:exodeoxyribonuclease-5
MRWGPQQAKALKDVDRWYKDANGPQVYRLFGYAGSGKTTLAMHIAQNIDGDVLFCAYTGKAARVMERSGCSGASTIHRLIYKVKMDPITGEWLGFELNSASDVANCALVVVDEASMVDEEIGEDLLSYEKKILVLGDPKQLPPVTGEGFFTNAEPDTMLTQIHRQALDNPIIYMATQVRRGLDLEVGRYGESRVTRKNMDLLGYSQIIVGKNDTRRSVNAVVRKLHGYEGDLPVLGEKLVGLKNNHQTGVLNGTTWGVQNIKPTSKGVVHLDLLEIDGLDIRVKSACPIECFQHDFAGEINGIELFQKYGRAAKDRFDFGHALTAHKCQGSQFDTVLIYDESYVFKENCIRWLYTSLTRAIDYVHVMV